MTRIDENYEAQRAAEAQQAQARKEAARKESNVQFNKLVQQQQNASADANKRAHAKNAERGAAANALMARQGISSHNLQSKLHVQGEATNRQAHTDVKQRRDDVNKREVDAEEKKTKLDNKELDKTQDRLAAIHEDDRRDRDMGSSGGGGGTSAGGDDSSSGSDASSQAQQVLLQGATPLADAQAAHGAEGPRIPPELIQQLVNRVFAGVSAEGFSQFTVELKSDVLNGARLDVVAKDGKISCTFHTNDKNVKNLLKASEGQLARAFAQKGLVLDRLAVEQG